MLAGYLPFDDDPANPDGDNINLLYRYIVNTPLSFPDYISTEARDLLSLMLVPDPARRTTLDGVMRHPWLSAYHSIRTDGQPNAFGKTVEDLEKAALDQHQQKRQAYQKQMKANVLTNGPVSPSRTQSYHPNHEVIPQSGSRSRSTQPEYLYDSSLDQTMASPPATHVNTTPSQNGTTRKPYGSPAALGLSEDDPFAGPENVSANNEVFTSKTINGSKQHGSDETSRGPSTLAPTATPPKGYKPTSSGAGGFRHTIQVEYDEPSSKNSRKSDEKRRERSGSQSHSTTNGQQNGVVSSVPPTTVTRERRSSQSSSKPLPPSPIIVPHSPNSQPSYRSPSTPKIPSPNVTPTKQTPTKVSRTNDSNGTPLATGDSLVVNVSSPPQTPRASAQQEKDKDTGSQKSASSTQKGHKKGKSSIDKLGLSKIFSSGFGPTSVNNTEGSAKNLQGSTTHVPSEGQGSATSVLLNPVGPDKDKETGKKSRRNTLTVMVEPFSRSIRNKKGRMTNTPLTPAPATGPPTERPSKLAVTTPPKPQSAVLPQTNGNMDFGDPNGLQASTSKARKVMQWFRTKSKGRDSVGFLVEEEVVSKEKGIASKYRRGFSSSSNTVNQTQVAATAPQTGFKSNGVVPVQVAVTSPSSGLPLQGGHSQRSASSALEVATPSSLVARFRNSITVGSNSHHAADKMHPHGQLRIHHGAVDQTTITTRPPPEVMAHVKKILEGMGVEIQLESEYKYRCIRAKKKKSAVGSSTVSSAGPTASLAAVTMVGSAASNGVSYSISSMGLFVLYPNIFFPP